MRRIIEAAKPYPEGRWLFIPLGSETDLRDVERLLIEKSPPKKRQEAPGDWKETRSSGVKS